MLIYKLKTFWLLRIEYARSDLRSRSLLQVVNLWQSDINILFFLSDLIVNVF
jgi:hypothetical protein